jgi:predicted metal-dependent hydrolase
MNKSALPQVFKQYNRKYFGNKLNISAIDFGKPTYHAHAETTFFDSADPIITINTRLMNSGRLVRIVLLHEMVHVSGCMNHGRAFVRHIKKLVRLGAYDDLL